MTDDEKKLTPAERIVKAKWGLTKDQPFFAVLTLGLKAQEDVNHVLPIPTIGVNMYGDLIWNAEFIDGLDDEELKGVLAHESLHFGLNHMGRGRGRDHKMFNQATDLVVNDIIITAGMKLPHGGLVPDKNHKFNFGSHMIEKINERPAEDVYRVMMQHAKEGGQGTGGTGNGTDQRDDGGFDNHDYDDKPDQPLSEQERKAIEQESKARMVEARNYAQGQGKLPAGMERLIEKLLPPKIPWKQVVQAVIVDTIPFDSTWARPGKKTQAVGCYMPRTVKDKTIDVVCAVDTSGSVSQKMLKKAISEVVGICNAYPNVKMTLMSHDSAVHSVIKVDRMSGDPVEQVMRWKPKGGGGTSHVPVWEWIEKNQPDCKVFIGLTDGMTDWGNEPMGYEKVFLISEGGVSLSQVPFGRALEMPIDGEDER